MLRRNTGFGLVELLIVIVILTVMVVLLMPVLARTQEGVRRKQCADNLRQLAQVHKMFAAENNGMWVPRMVPYHLEYSEIRPCWSSFDGAMVYPDYFKNHMIVLCLSDEEYEGEVSIDSFMRPVHGTWQDAPDPNPVRGLAQYPETSDVSYVYWGYAIDPSDVVTKEDMVVIGRYLDSLDGPSINLRSRFEDHTITKPSTGEELTLHRFQDGVERLVFAEITDPIELEKKRASIAVMWDTIRTDMGVPTKEYNHGTGGNVLFMDGHVEYRMYPQETGGPFWMLSEPAHMEGVTEFP